MSEETDEENAQKVKTPWWENFACGGLAGFVGITALFPMHKTMFRQMLHGVPTSKAISQLRKEGLFTLYRGIGPPLCLKTVSVSIMFGTYENFGQALRVRFPKMHTRISKSLAGAMAGWTEIPYTQPFERIQTLLQDRTFNAKFQNTYHAFKFIYKHHGLREFYRGTSPVAVRNAISNILFFTGKENTYEVFPRPDGLMSRYITNFISGGVLGAVCSTIMYPTNVIKTRMQSKLGGTFESPIEAYKALLKERGKFRSLYRGVHINFTRSLLQWGINNSTYEFLKDSVDKLREVEDNRNLKK